MTRTRKRGQTWWSNRTYPYRGYYGSTGQQVASTNYAFNFFGTETCTDEENDWYRHGSSRSDVGGVLFSDKVEYEPGNVSNRKHTWSYIGSNYSYEGPVFPNGSSFFDLAASAGISYSSIPALQAKGATAIARTTPTSPVFSAATFIGELKEGLPSIVGSSFVREQARAARRKGGGEYLNVEFGWKPLISDVRKFAYAVRESHKILTQFERDSGRVVRRRYTFPQIKNVTVSEGAGVTPVPAPMSEMFSGGAFQFPRTITRTTQTDTWFSGAFQYYLNMGDSARDQLERHAQEANKLLGTRITPEVLWNVAPWSWAIDWVGNVGDIAHNISAFSNDGLVLKYGYIMEKSMSEVRSEMRGVRFADRPNVPETLHHTYRRVVKQRLPATPYGFGFAWDGFSPRQLAIIAALGLSRG